MKSLESSNSLTDKIVDSWEQEWLNNYDVPSKSADTLDEIRAICNAARAWIARHDMPIPDRRKEK